MEASEEQLDRMFGLAKEFADMRGRPMPDVIHALLTSDTLKSYDYDGSGHITRLQADAAIGLLERWIEKAGEA